MDALCLTERLIGFYVMWTTRVSLQFPKSWHLCHFSGIAIKGCTAFIVHYIREEEFD